MKIPMHPSDANALHTRVLRRCVQREHTVPLDPYGVCQASPRSPCVNFWPRSLRGSLRPFAEGRTTAAFGSYTDSGDAPPSTLPITVPYASRAGDVTSRMWMGIPPFHRVGDALKASHPTKSIGKGAH